MFPDSSVPTYPGCTHPASNDAMKLAIGLPKLASRALVVRRSQLIAGPLGLGQANKCLAT